MARRPNRAERAAIDLLERLSITEIPTPVETITRRLGIDLRSEEPLEGELSAILYQAEGSQVVIGVNAGHAPVRQRFSIAHELGHHELHKDALYVDGFIRRDDKSSLALDSQEIEANAFAAELLMPQDIVIQEVERHLSKTGLADPAKLIRQLAKTFDVSEQAMAIRLTNLGLNTSI